MSGKTKKLRTNYKNAGLGQFESRPIYNKRSSKDRFKSEEVIGQAYNSNIVFGDDRFAEPHTGFGGARFLREIHEDDTQDAFRAAQRDTQCSSLDIVVGRGGPFPRTEDGSGDPQATNPRFVDGPSYSEKEARLNKTRFESKYLSAGLGVEYHENRSSMQPSDTNQYLYSDSCRIYLTQKGNLDKYFKLTKGRGSEKTVTLSKSDKSLDERAPDNTEEGSYLDPRSGIAMKADQIRIMSREGIKIVTNCESKDYTSSPYGKNSQGHIIGNKYGIDLIALNDGKDLQPLVKGENLIECIKEMVNVINNLQEYVNLLMKSQDTFNRALMNHMHITTHAGAKTTPSVKVLTEGFKNQLEQLKTISGEGVGHYININHFEGKYLSYGNTKPNSKFILSRYNNTN